MQYSDALEVLADGTRIKIVELLSQRNYCVGVLGRILGISAPAVSQHMKILQSAGLVDSEKIGYHTHYCVNRELLRKIGKELTEMADTPPKVCEKRGMQCGMKQAGRCMKAGCGADQ